MQLISDGTVDYPIQGAGVAVARVIVWKDAAGAAVVLAEGRLADPPAPGAVPESTRALIDAVGVRHDLRWPKTAWFVADLDSGRFQRLDLEGGVGNPHRVASVHAADEAEVRAIVDGDAPSPGRGTASIGEALEGLAARFGGGTEAR